MPGKRRRTREARRPGPGQRPRRSGVAAGEPRPGRCPHWPQSWPGERRTGPPRDGRLGRGPGRVVGAGQTGGGGEVTPRAEGQNGRHGRRRGRRPGDTRRPPWYAVDNLVANLVAVANVNALIRAVAVARRAWR